MSRIPPILPDDAGVQSSISPAGTGSDPALIATRLAQVRGRIAAVEAAAGRTPGSVRLLLATKTLDAATVTAALAADKAAIAANAAITPVAIGENRVQELVAKAPVVAELASDIHLIGPLQSNKVNAALRWADCIQTVTDLELAHRLDRRCVIIDRTVDVLIQVNVSDESSKHGTPPDHAASLARAVAALPRLRLRGLMTVGANTPDTAVVRAGYATLRELRDQIRDSAPGTDTVVELSMGMSRDIEVAVAEGATIVRVGSAVFGARPVPVSPPVW